MRDTLSQNLLRENLLCHLLLHKLEEAFCRFTQDATHYGQKIIAVQNVCFTSTPFVTTVKAITGLTKHMQDLSTNNLNEHGLVTLIIKKNLSGCTQALGMFKICNYNLWIRQCFRQFTNSFSNMEKYCMWVW